MSQLRLITAAEKVSARIKQEHVTDEHIERDRTPRTREVRLTAAQRSTPQQNA